jgi:hypothetical protein
MRVFYHSGTAKKRTICQQAVGNFAFFSCVLISPHKHKMPHPAVFTTGWGGFAAMALRLFPALLAGNGDPDQA